MRVEASVKLGAHCQSQQSDPQTNALRNERALGLGVVGQRMKGAGQRKTGVLHRQTDEGRYRIKEAKVARVDFDRIWLMLLSGACF